MTYVWQGNNEPTVALPIQRAQPSVEEDSPPWWALALVAAAGAVLFLALMLVAYPWANRPFLDNPDPLPSAPAVVEFVPAPPPPARPLPRPLLLQVPFTPADHLR